MRTNLNVVNTKKKNGFYEENNSRNIRKRFFLHSTQFHWQKSAN